MPKSAATLLALSGDKLIMCKAAELGSLDPYVEDPTTHVYVPAHSIEKALDFIAETKDPIVKVSMADKIPPLLMGAYRDAQDAAKVALKEMFADKPNVEEIVKKFTIEPPSHGYPIMRENAKGLLDVEEPDPDLEQVLHELIETYIDFMIEAAPGERLIEEEVSIFQSRDKYIAIIKGEVHASL